jgi:hypothetical protein
MGPRRSDGCACVMGRWHGAPFTLAKDGPTAAFISWTEDHVEGGLVLSGTTGIVLPADGSYLVAFRAYVVLNNIMPGTTHMAVDAFEFNSDQRFFNDVVYLDADRTFQFLKGVDIATVAAGTELLFRVRLDVLATQSGDAVDVEPELAVTKICGCDTPTI